MNNCCVALKELFIVRDDCYCVQQVHGAYVKINEPLTLDLLEKHLKGEITLGSYQLDKNSSVKWLCFDIDPEKVERPQDVVSKILDVCFEEKVEKDGAKRPRIWKKAVLLEASRWNDPSFHIWIMFLAACTSKGCTLARLPNP